MHDRLFNKRLKVRSLAHLVYAYTWQLELALTECRECLDGERGHSGECMASCEKNLTEALEDIQMITDVMKSLVPAVQDLKKEMEGHECLGCKFTDTKEE